MDPPQLRKKVADFKNRKEGERFTDSRGIRYKYVGGQSRQLCTGSNNTCTNVRSHGKLCHGHHNGTAQTPNAGLKKGDEMILNGIRYRYNGTQKVQLCDYINTDGDLCEQVRVKNGRCKTHSEEWHCKFTEYACIRIRTHGDYCSRHRNNIQHPKEKSKGETLISKELENMGVDFVSNASIICDGKVLYPDFQLINLNAIVEFDGKQHFHAIDYWGGEEKLRNVQENDHIKDQWCKDNGVVLLRIAYTDFDIIPDVIEGFLSLLPAIDPKNKDEIIWSSNFPEYIARGYSPVL